MSELSHRPVGIIDSGFGGLSVARAVRAYLPEETLYYAADCAHAPWGEKSDAAIQARVMVLVEHLLALDIKALVIACNTATVTLRPYLKSVLSIPVVGIEPALEESFRRSKTQRIGVMGTTKTVTSPAYLAQKARFMPPAHIVDCACPGLMECVERGDFTGADTRHLLETLTRPLVDAQVDTVALACTHYPFLKETIAEVLPAGTTLVDPAPEIARRLEVRLTEANRLNTKRTLTDRFFTTGVNEHRQALLKTLWREDAQFEGI